MFRRPFRCPAVVVAAALTLTLTACHTKEHRAEEAGASGSTTSASTTSATPSAGSPATSDQATPAESATSAAPAGLTFPPLRQTTRPKGLPTLKGFSPTSTIGDFTVRSTDRRASGAQNSAFIATKILTSPQGTSPDELLAALASSALPARQRNAFKERLAAQLASGGNAVWNYRRGVWYRESFLGPQAELDQIGFEVHGWTVSPGAELDDRWTVMQLRLKWTAFGWRLTSLRVADFTPDRFGTDGRPTYLRELGGMRVRT